MPTHTEIQREIRKFINPEKAAFYPTFFKTKKGEYGYGDKFLGVTVPHQRMVAKKFKDAPYSSIEKLIKSVFHEDRLTALLILTYKMEKAPEAKQKEIVEFYLKNIDQVNNWDLVDASCHKILGKYYFERSRKKLYQLAKSKNMWHQRVAIITTMYFIKKNDLDDTYALAGFLLEHEHDLMHKAVGWMLRESGKKDSKRLLSFIKKNYQRFPRTALRYAIEKLPTQKRKNILLGKF